MSAHSATTEPLLKSTRSGQFGEISSTQQPETRERTPTKTMAEYQFKYTTKPEHFRAYVAAVPWRLTRAKRNHFGSRAYRIGTGLAIGIVLALAFIAIDQSCQDAASPCWLDPISTINGAIAAFAMFFAANVFYHRQQIQRMVSTEGAYVGPTTISANSERLEAFSEHVRATYDWEAFNGLDQEDNILILWIDRGVGLFIPRTCFASSEAETEFIAFCREQIDRAAVRKANIVRFT
ncbi:MAG: YcxB family protein [Pseudomonadota bacterium]